MQSASEMRKAIDDECGRMNENVPGQTALEVAKRVGRLLHDDPGMLPFAEEALAQAASRRPFSVGPGGIADAWRSIVRGLQIGFHLRKNENSGPDTGPHPSSSTGTTEIHEGPTANSEHARTEYMKTISAKPYVWRDPASIPPRAWLLAHHYCRRYLTATVGAGGVAKTTLAIAEAIEMATGRRDLVSDLGQRKETPLKVWMINLEDPQDELDLRIAAACTYHRIDAKKELVSQLWINSGRDRPIVFAKSNGSGPVQLDDAVLKDFEETIVNNHIDMVFMDPLVSCHHLNESDNPAMDMLCKALRAIADRANCGLEFLHHTRKTGPNATADDSRGASSIVNAMRSVRVLSRMTKDDAAKYGVENPNEYIRIEKSKANMSSASAKWVKLVVVRLPNGESVCTVESWSVPENNEGITEDHMHEVREIIGGGNFKKDPQTGNQWVGLVIAQVVGLDPVKDNRRIKKIQKDWLDLDVLAVEYRSEKTGKQVPYIIKGAWKRASAGEAEGGASMPKAA